MTTESESVMTTIHNDADVVRERTATYAEIRRQPRMWRETVALLVARREEIRAFLAPRLSEDSLRIVLTGAGTSAFAGEVIAPALRTMLGRRVDAVATTDIVASPESVFAEDVPTLLISFARSGNSPESAAATALADELLTDVAHVVITCDLSGDLARAHESSVTSLLVGMPAETNDTGFAMTSSFTSMTLAALLLFDGESAGLVEELGQQAEQLFAEDDAIGALLERPVDRVVYLGAGPLAGLARESALKLLELTAGGVVGLFDTPLGFRHGPKAVVDDTTLLVVYRSADPYTALYDDDIVAELRAVAPGRVIRVGGEEQAGRTDFPLPLVSAHPDAYRAVVAVVFAQLLALHASVKAGCAPDNPFPGGTVNRVVQGVTVYPHPSSESVDE